MNGQWKKELAKLQRDKVKAQNQKDLKQESEICNRIGLLYVENGQLKLCSVIIPKVHRS